MVWNWGFLVSYERMWAIRFPIINKCSWYSNTVTILNMVRRQIKLTACRQVCPVITRRVTTIYDCWLFFPCWDEEIIEQLTLKEVDFCGRAISTYWYKSKNDSIVAVAAQPWLDLVRDTKLRGGPLSVRSRVRFARWVLVYACIETTPGVRSRLLA